MALSVKLTTVVMLYAMVYACTIYMCMHAWSIDSSSLINSPPPPPITACMTLTQIVEAKGMYGMNVHNAVIAQGEKESGITIHYVTSEYDKGAIIFQATTQIDKEDTPDDLATKIHALEHEHFPQVLEKLLTAE